MSLGENIRKKREERKLSQEYVAEKLGVSRQAVSKWETAILIAVASFYLLYINPKFMNRKLTK